jgi:hypothetical protein
MVGQKETPVGGLAALAIPNEDVGGGYDDGGMDIDTGAEMAPVIKRPERDEWISLLVSAMLTVRLLVVRQQGQDYRVSYFYVHPSIRPDVAEDLKPCRVVPYFSWLYKRHFLYVSSVAEPGKSGWGDSLGVIWAKSPEWHAERALRIRSNREAGRYDIRQKPIPGTAVWPVGETGELLATALGTAGIITDPTHPVYQRLLEGEEIA